MPSYREKVLAKQQAGIAPREKVVREPIVKENVQPIADATTPVKVAGDEATKAIQAPIDTAKAEAKMVEPVGQTGQVTGQVQPQNTIPLRQTLENQGIKVDWNPETGQVTANGMLVDTSRMSLANGSYSASYQDINDIIQQVQGQQQPQAQTPAGEYQQAAQEGAEQKEAILGKFQEEVSGITEEFQNRQPLYTEDIQQSLRQAFGDPFEYDPNKDPALQEAQKYAEREIVNAMNARGILNSTITRDEYASMLSSMIPKYESIAFDRYQTNINNQLKRVNVLRSLSQDDYRMYKDQVDFTLQNLENVTTNAIDMIDDNLKTMYDTTIRIPNEEADRESKRIQDELQNAYDKLDATGYVDNEMSAITGIPAGTLSKDAKKILGSYIMSEEEKQKLLAGEIEMADIEQRAKEQEIREAQQEVEIKTQAQMAFSQMAGDLAQMTADEAIDMLPTIDSQMQEFLGEYYYHVTDDINKLRDDLLRRRQTEVDQQISRQREQRLREGATSIGGKGAKDDEGGVTGTMRTRVLKSIDEIAKKYFDPKLELTTTTPLMNKRNFVDEIEPLITELSEEDMRILLKQYGITEEDVAKFEGVSPTIKPITGFGGFSMGGV